MWREMGGGPEGKRETFKQGSAAGKDEPEMEVRALEDTPEIKSTTGTNQVKGDGRQSKSQEWLLTSTWQYR